MAPTQLVKDLLEHRDIVLGFLYALTREYDTAEELFQEVSLAILDEAAKGTQVLKFLPWAREIARRRVAEYYRKRSRPEPLPEELADLVSEAFAEQEAETETLRVRLKFLAECLQRLPGRSRDVIESRYRGRKSAREIAGELDWKEASVKVALSRARKTLADCVSNKLRLAGE